MPELIHTFRLPVPVDRAWAALDDPDLVASAFPGAEVRDRGSDDVTGVLSVKVGPVRARYDGTVRVTWRDRPARRFVLEATGDEVDGLGTLRASVHVTLSEVDDADATDVELRTILNVTGRAAQFGEAVLGDVLARHLEGLAAGLEAAGFPDAPPRPDLPERGRRTVGAFAEPVAEREAAPEPSWSDDRLPSAAGDLDEPDALELRELPADELGPRRPASSLPPPPPPPPAPSPAPAPAPAPEPEAAVVEPERDPEPASVPEAAVGEPEPAPAPEPAPEPAAPAAPPLPPPPPPPPPTEVLSWSPPRREPDAETAPEPAAPVLRPDRPVARVALRKAPKPTLAAPPPGGPTRPVPAVVPPSEPPSASGPGAGGDAAPPPPPPPPPPPAPTPAPVVASRPARPGTPASAPVEDPSMVAKAAPYAVVLLLLWILRRMFGSGDR